MSALQAKSLTQLRSIAQGFGVTDIFTKNEVQLRQDIELKQQGMIPEPKIDIPLPPYDARLMTKAPARKLNEGELRNLLTPYEARGLKFEVVNHGENWKMSCGKKNDTGNMRMPARVVLLKAQEMLN